MSMCYGLLAVNHSLIVRSLAWFAVEMLTWFT